MPTSVELVRKDGKEKVDDEVASLSVYRNNEDSIEVRQDEEAPLMHSSRPGTEEPRYVARPWQDTGPISSSTLVKVLACVCIFAVCMFLFVTYRIVHNAEYWEKTVEETALEAKKFIENYNTILPEWMVAWIHSFLKLKPRYQASCVAAIPATVITSFIFILALPLTLNRKWHGSEVGFIKAFLVLFFPLISVSIFNVLFYLFALAVGFYIGYLFEISSSVYMWILVLVVQGIIFYASSAAVMLTLHNYVYDGQTYRKYLPAFLYNKILINTFGRSRVHPSVSHLAEGYAPDERA